MQHFPIPTISYELSMQRRYEAVKATIAHFKKPVPESQKPQNMYNLDNSDDGATTEETNTLNKTDEIA